VVRVHIRILRLAVDNAQLANTAIIPEQFHVQNVQKDNTARWSGYLTDRGVTHVYLAHTEALWVQPNVCLATQALLPIRLARSRSVMTAWQIILPLYSIQ